jgi:hypothetical protein
LKNDLEDYLGIEKIEDPRKSYLKPLNVMWHYQNDKIGVEKIKAFKTKIENVLS